MKSERRRSLDLSILEGSFYAIMVGCSESLALFFAAKKGVSSKELAVLTTLPVLLGALAQWIVPYFVAHSWLKRTMLIFISVQLTGLGGLLVASQESAPYGLLLISLSLYWIGGLTCGPLWLDWISGWLPQQHLPRYLSKRNALLAIVTLISYLISTGLLHLIDSDKGFLAIFFGAFVARCASWTTMLQQTNPGTKIPHMLRQQVRPQVDSVRIVVLSIFISVLFKFVVNVASPFFLPYMLQDLRFDLFHYTCLTAVPFIGRFLFLARWGEATRSMRPVIGLQIAMVLIAVVPALWTYNQHLGYLSLLEFFSGSLWGGFDLCAMLIVQSFWRGSARKILGLHLSLMSLASLLGAHLGAYWHQQGLSFEEIFIRSSNGRAFVAFLGILLFLGLRESRTPLKIYGNFLSTVLSLRLSLDSVGRILPLRRKDIKFS